jgi:transcriptional regulator with XRE-family HTH domain
MIVSDHPLRLWRTANGVTLAKLAAEVGVTASHLSEVERGRNNLSLDLAAKLSRATGNAVSLERFAEAAE